MVAVLRSQVMAMSVLLLGVNPGQSLECQSSCPRDLNLDHAEYMVS